MLTIKLMKYAPEVNGCPTYTEAVTIRQAKAVHLRYEKDGRQVLQLGDAPDDTMDVTIGTGLDCSYQCAYIMNDQGRTVETIR